MTQHEMPAHSSLTTESYTTEKLTSSLQISISYVREHFNA